MKIWDVFFLGVFLIVLALAVGFVAVVLQEPCFGVFAFLFGCVALITGISFVVCPKSARDDMVSWYRREFKENKPSEEHHVG